MRRSIHPRRGLDGLQPAARAKQAPGNLNERAEWAVHLVPLARPAVQKNEPDPDEIEPVEPSAVSPASAVRRWPRSWRNTVRTIRIHLDWQPRRRDNSLRRACRRQATALDLLARSSRRHRTTLGGADQTSVFGQRAPRIPGFRGFPSCPPGGQRFLVNQQIQPASR